VQAVPQHLCNPHRAIVRERVRSCFVSRGGLFGPRCAGCWSRVRQDDGSAPPGQHVWEAGVARSGGLGVGAAQGLDWASTGIPTHIHAHGVDVRACFGQDAISAVPRCWSPRGPPWGRPCCTALFVRREDKTTTTTATMMDGAQKTGLSHSVADDVSGRRLRTWDRGVTLHERPPACRGVAFCWLHRLLALLACLLHFRRAFVHACVRACLPPAY